MDKYKQIQAEADDKIERMRIAESWGPTIDALGVSRNEFCRMAGRDAGDLSRRISGDMGSSWNVIRKIDADIIKVKKELKRK